MHQALDQHPEQFAIQPPDGSDEQGLRESGHFRHFKHRGSLEARPSKSWIGGLQNNVNFGDSSSPLRGDEHDQKIPIRPWNLCQHQYGTDLCAYPVCKREAGQHHITALNH